MLKSVHYLQTERTVMAIKLETILQNFHKCQDLSLSSNALNPVTRQIREVQIFILFQL